MATRGKTVKITKEFASDDSQTEEGRKEEGEEGIRDLKPTGGRGRRSETVCLSRLTGQQAAARLKSRLSELDAGSRGIT